MARIVRDPDLSAKFASKAAEFDAMKDTPHLKQPSEWLRDGDIPDSEGEADACKSDTGGHNRPGG